MTGIYVGELGHFVVMSISMYPPLDSLVFLLSIRDYRNALFCNTKTDIRNESSNTRPATAKVSVRNREWSGLNLEFSNWRPSSNDRQSNSDGKSVFKSCPPESRYSGLKIQI